MYPGDVPTAYLLDRAVRDAPDHLFLADETRRLSFLEAHEQVSRLAAGLERLGIGRGDFVLLALHSGIDYPILMLALHALGAASVNGNPLYSEDEFAFVYQDSKPKLVITEASLVQVVRAACPGARHVVIDAAAVTAADEVAWKDLFETFPAGRLTRREVTPDDAATVIYTSGTTSRPKGVVFRQGSHGFGGEYMTRNLGVRADDIFYCPMPLFHSAAIQNCLFPMLTVHGTLVLRRWSTTHFLPDVVKWGATVTFGGVPQWRMIIAHHGARPGCDKAPGSKLRALLNGGAMLVEEYEAVESLLGGRFSEIFGQTEGIVPCTITPLYARNPKRGTGGAPGLGSEVRIRKPDGGLAGPGEPGEIEFRTHGLGARMLGFLNQPEQTAAIFTDDDFIRSMDLGYLDEDGWLFFVGRIKDMIKVGGENVAAPEVERVLDEHPAVRESAAVPVVDPMLGHVVGAFVVLADGASIEMDELIAHCAGRLAKFKTPRIVRPIEVLPRNALGKVVKSELPAL